VYSLDQVQSDFPSGVRGEEILQKCPQILDPPE
jgi:hypothetical protein